MKTVIVIPAYNEGKRIAAVLLDLKNHNYHNIIVADDGSSDDTGLIAKRLGAWVVRHRVNMGPGAATQTGILAALRDGADIIVTMDADGQHLAEDIAHLTAPISDGNDIVIGSRFKGNSPIPIIRKIYNTLGNLTTLFLSGIYVTDSQSGLKAMNADFAKKLDLEHNGFEFCTEIIQKIKVKKAKYIEVPIQVRYTQDTLAKGQSFISGIQMVINFLYRRIMP